MTDWHGKAKWLAQLLLISGSLNIGLIATLCYFALKDKETFMSYELVPNSHKTARASLTQTNEEALGALLLTSCDDLIRYLSDDTLIEEGYRKRDLALTCLVDFHHFDIARALPHLDRHVRIANFTDDQGKTITLHFYPHLTDEHFFALRKFAEKEQFPFTTEGLFEQLAVTRTQAVEKAFQRTFEYQALEAIFAHTGDRLSQDALTDLILDGEWATLQKVAEHIRAAPQRTLETKRNVLIEYLRAGSETAAEMLLTQDFQFAVKRLSNEDMGHLLALSGMHKERLVAAVAETLRPIEVAQAPPAPTPGPETRTHLIVDGDTLWDIAKAYHVRLDDLISANDISSEYRLRPGKTLVIP